MKIRQGNANKRANGDDASSLIVGIPPDMRKHMGLVLGSEVMWRLNEAGKWEIIKLEVSE